MCCVLEFTKKCPLVLHHAHTKRRTPGCSFTPLIQSTKGIAESTCVLWTQMFSSWQCHKLYASKTLKSGSRSALANTKHPMYNPSHDIAKEIGYERARALPMFHAFVSAGCDTVSSFADMGQNTAFEIWKSFNEVTSVFSTLQMEPLINQRQLHVCVAGILYIYTTALAQKIPSTLPEGTFFHQRPIYGQQTTNRSSPAKSHMTGDIPGWICMGTGIRPLSSYSVSRHLRLAKDYDARLATNLDTGARCGGLVS